MSAHAFLLSAMAAMGGQDRLRAIHAVSMTSVGTRYMVEQSERPSGPYFIDHFRRSEIRDLRSGHVRVEQSDEGYAADKWWLQQTEPFASTVIVNGDVVARVSGNGLVYGGTAPVQQTEEELAFAPERLLQTADAASDLRALPDVMLHGMRHHVVAFTWKGAPCTLYLNASTDLPWKISWTRAYPYHTFLSVWGDVPSSITFNGWSLEPFGISYPREWTYERLGLPDQQFSIVQLQINPLVDPAKLTVPADLYARYHGKILRVADIPLGYRGSSDPVTVAPGIIQYQGGWNVEFVREPQGLIALEAPWSPQYTARALAAAQKRFGMPVKAVITTSDSWPHIAGVRQAVAMGVPVYALDLNVPILTRLVDAPHTQLPDDLQLHPKKPHVIAVSSHMSVGSGKGRLEIIPYRSATGERQMMVYFPTSQLLYTSDLLAPDGNGGWFTPQYVHELLGAVAREHLAVKTVFGMHYAPTPFSQLTEYVKHFTDLGFFLGARHCAGTFASSGKAITSNESFALESNGIDLVKQHDDLPPYTYHATERWSFDSAANVYQAKITDSTGGVRTFTSPGWTGKTLTWTDQRAPGTAEQFIYERMADAAYRVSYHVVKGGSDRLVDSLVCR